MFKNRAMVCLVILYYLVKERITGTDNEHIENISIEIPDSWRGLI